MSFKLVFEGRTVAGEDRFAVEARLAELLKVDADEVRRLFEKAPTVIKKDLDRRQARIYQTAFEKTGALCEVVPMDEEGLAPMPAPPSPAVFPEPPRDGSPSQPIEELPREPTGHRALLSLAAPVLLMALTGGFLLWRSLPVSRGPGQVAPEDPVQRKLEQPLSFPHGEYEIHPVASFSIEARVLRTERYRFDDGADLVPWDFALGWGPMSDEAVIEELSIGQGARFYTWSAREFPIPRREIEVHSANMHLIPSTPQIARRMGQARRGQIVSMMGYLVTATGANGWRWKSSTTRDDTGPGACELVYVESLELR